MEGLKVRLVASHRREPPRALTQEIYHCEVASFAHERSFN